MIINNESFRGTFKGKPVELYTLKNKNGILVQLTNFGGKIVSLLVPDSKGQLADIVLGYETAAEYISGNAYFGALVGRYANRIAKGRFSIDGTEYHLPVNNGPNSLHGGPEGFSNQVFDFVSSDKKEGSETIKFAYFSKDGEEGYPGNLRFTLTVSLNDNNELRLDYEAVTDRATHVNICTHPFFNLAGEGNGDVLDHLLTINAVEFTPVDPFQIPTGEFRKVDNTPFDFRNQKRIGEQINDKDVQLGYGAGYDHNWVLSKPEGKLGLAAVYTDPVSGRVMEILTTQPGLQFYSANWLDGSDKGKGGKAYTRRSALCLETQHFPDSPNKPGFPSTLLRPGQVYLQTCVHKFSVK